MCENIQPKFVCTVVLVIVLTGRTMQPSLATGALSPLQYTNRTGKLNTTKTKIFQTHIAQC